MKKLIVVFATIMTALCANAQWGVKAGLNLADLTGDGTDDVKMLPSFHGGVFYNVPINEMFSFQPDLLYSGQGGKASSGDEKILLSYINLAPLIRYNHQGFFAGTGPQVGFLLSAKDKSGGASVDVKDFVKSTDFSWAFLIGYQLQSGFGFYGRYNVGISNIDDSGSGGKLHNSVLAFGFQYSFQNAKK
jgi:hypothetical protein